MKTAETTGDPDAVGSVESVQRLTPQEVADELRVGYKLVWRMINRGELPAYHVGRKLRIDRADLDAMLAKTRVSVSAHAKRTRTRTA